MKHHHTVLRTLLLVSAVALSACKSKGRQESTDAPRPLSGAFEIFETRRGSDETKQPLGTLVDYDSEIIARPDRIRIAEAIGRSAPEGPETPEAARASAHIDSLEQQLAGIDDLEETLRLIAEYEKESEEYFTNDFAEGMLLQDDASWLRILRKEQRIVEALDEVSLLYVSQTLFDGRRPDLDLEKLEEASEPDEAAIDALGDAPDEINDAASQVYHRMAPITDPAALESDDLPLFDSFDPEEVTEIVNATAAALRARMLELEKAVLARATDVELLMEAHLLRGGTSTPIPILPYFKVEGVGRGDKPGRIGIPSKADVERVQAGFEANAKLAESMNELIDIAGDDERLDALREGMVDALEVFAKDLLEGLEEDLKEVSLIDGELQTVKDDAQAVLVELRLLKAGVDALRADASSSDPANLLGDAVALMNQLRGEDGLKGLLEKLAGSLKALPTALVEDLPEEARGLIARVKQTVAREANELVKALAQQPATGSAAKLFVSLKQLSSLAKKDSFAGLEPGKIERNPLPLDQAQNGSVRLSETPAKQGDQLEIRYKVTAPKQEAEPPAEGEEEPADPAPEPGVDEYGTSTLLDVRMFGWYTTLKSQILFYNRLDDGSSSFRAAPGISYNLHYRPEKAQAFWDGVAPGIGLSVSAPSFEDGTELAVGGQLTFANDMIQAGLAYNISVDDDHVMYYFGFDLIGVFQAID